MHFLSALLFAVSANMDNIAIGAAYGIKNRPLRFQHNALIALLTAGGTLFAMAAGSLLSSIFPRTTAKYLGCSLLILMGLWFALQPFRRSAPDTGQAAGHTSVVSVREIAALAAALTANNAGFGAGACMAGLPIALTAFFTFLCSMLFLSAGLSLGQRLRRAAQNPDAADPHSAKQNAAEPDATEPGAAMSGAAESGRTEPGAATSGAAEPSRTKRPAAFAAGQYADFISGLIIVLLGLFGLYF